MEIGPDALAALATGAGAPAWAAAIGFIIETLKSVPQLGVFVDGRERLWAFVLALALVAAAFAVAVTSVPPTAELSLLGLIGAIMAWFTVGRLAIALHDDATGRANSLTGPSLR